MSASMQSWDPRGAPVGGHQDMAAALLPLADSEILSLSGTAGDLGPAIAAAVKSATVVVLETGMPVDEPLPLSNLTYRQGPADRIPAADESFDIVIVNGLLSRLPDDVMEPALREIRRVLRPGGLAHIAEPVFGGAFNEILRVFADEKQARLNAFEAVQATIASGGMTLETQKFFQMLLTLTDFDAVEEFLPPEIKATTAQKTEAKQKFDRHMTPKGATFKVPMRIDLLRKSD